MAGEDACPTTFSPGPHEACIAVTHVSARRGRAPQSHAIAIGVPFAAAQAFGPRSWFSQPGPPDAEPRRFAVRLKAGVRSVVRAVPAATRGQ